MNEKEELRKYISKNEDKKNAEFEKKLIATNYKIYGLKTALLESYAKELAKKNINVDQLMPLESYEEIMVAGFLIGKGKYSPSEKIKQFKKLLPYIDNWGTCDCILSRLKNMESESHFFFSLLNDTNPFYQRVGIVWMLKYYLKIDIKHALLLIKNTKSDNYYLKMAKSWAYAEAFIYDFENTKKTLLEEKDVFVIKKALQKALESYRINDKQKIELKQLRENFPTWKKENLFFFCLEIYLIYIII